jgi:hypothetical protein
VAPRPFDRGVTTPGPNAIAEFMEQRPKLVAELLRVHVDDGTGHCRGCSWWQSATPVHPCGIRVVRGARRRGPAAPLSG